MNIIHITQRTFKIAAQGNLKSGRKLNEGGLGMSLGLKEFKEKLAKDEAFAKKFKEVTSLEQLLEIASADGFSFTVEDVKKNTELIDEELKNVVGGTVIFTSSYFVNT
jgi:predicted ribosomally synthesized peptide with nif11-like leader